LCKSTIKSWKYNKMVGKWGWGWRWWRCSGKMMEMMSKPPMIRLVMTIGALLLVPPPSPFRRWVFCEFWCLWMSYLRSTCTGWKLLMRRHPWHLVWAHGTGGLFPYWCSLKLLEVANRLLLGSLPPRCDNNNHLVFNGFQSTYLCPKIVTLLIVSINSFRFGILFKTNKKGVHKRGKILKS
jgi:hypothetical protein